MGVTSSGALSIKKNLTLIFEVIILVQVNPNESPISICMTISDGYFSFNASLHSANLAGEVKVSVFIVHRGGVVDDIWTDAEGYIGDAAAVH